MAGTEGGLCPAVEPTRLLMMMKAEQSHQPIGKGYELQTSRLAGYVHTFL